MASPHASSTTSEAAPQTVPMVESSKDDTTKEPAKCWICFDDETEDDRTKGTWRSPCQCSLRAHEKCLLHWIAEEDNQKGSQYRVQCPQCKQKIYLEEPRAPLVHLYARWDNYTKTQLPGQSLFMFLGSSVVTSFWLYGLGTVYLIFGQREADRWLGLGAIGQPISTLKTLSLTLIPVGVIASQFDSFWWVAQAIAPFLLPNHFGIFIEHTSRWPPLIPTTICYLPTIRLMYKLFWQKMFGSFELRLDKVIARTAGPQEGRQNGDEAANPLNGPGLGAGLDVAAIEEVDGVLVPEPAAQGGNAAEDPQAQQANQQPGPAPPAAENPHVIHLNPINLLAKTYTILSVPALSVAIGDTLSWFLPVTWRVPPSPFDRYPRGFLQTRFGRTVAGGCMFILFRDSFLLYCKYQSVQIRQQRRVLDAPRTAR